jgi:hypothetical protein
MTLQFRAREKSILSAFLREKSNSRTKFGLLEKMKPPYIFEYK